MDEDTIRSVVKRLSRENSSGAQVIERAAIMAEGTDSNAILDWITSHDGRPETQAAIPAGRGGLHGDRTDRRQSGGSATPQRYVLPPSAVTD